MAITNFPGGVSSFGQPVLPDCLKSRNFAKVLWVGNRTGLKVGDGSSPTNPLPTLLGTGGGLDKAAASGDTLINVLQGHAESVTGADAASLLTTKTGVVVLGHGDIYNRPTFTWTTAATTWLFDSYGHWIVNCNLLLEPGTGTVTVAAPITVSAAGCAIIGCKLRTSTDASNLTTIPVTTTAAGDDFRCEDNTVYGATAGECTTAFQFVGADRLKFKGNYVAVATSAGTTGVVRFLTTASTDIEWEGNTLINRKALSSVVVSGLANTSGISRDDTFVMLATTGLAPWSTAASVNFHRPTVSNTYGHTGSESVGTVST